MVLRKPVLILLNCTDAVKFAWVGRNSELLDTIVFHSHRWTALAGWLQPWFFHNRYYRKNVEILCVPALEEHDQRIVGTFVT